MTLLSNSGQDPPNPKPLLLLSFGLLILFTQVLVNAGWSWEVVTLISENEPPTVGYTAGSWIRSWKDIYFFKLQGYI